VKVIVAARGRTLLIDVFVSGGERGGKMADQAVEGVDKGGYLSVLRRTRWPGPVLQVQNAGHLLTSIPSMTSPSSNLQSTSILLHFVFQRILVLHFCWLVFTSVISQYRV